MIEVRLLGLIPHQAAFHQAASYPRGVNERTRRLAWEGLLNARDLGGYPTADGGETRWGAVVRSDNLTPLTEDGRAALLAYGIRSIVDLRRPEEAERYRTCSPSRARPASRT